MLAKFLGLCPFLGVSNKIDSAIGMGLATSVNRLRESDAKSRVVISLTDGCKELLTIFLLFHTVFELMNRRENSLIF